MKAGALESWLVRAEASQNDEIQIDAKDREGLAMDVRALAGRLYHLSPAALVGWSRNRLDWLAPSRPSASAVTIEYLRSPDYSELMTRGLPFPGDHDRHEAQNETRSFRLRHREQARTLGAFRCRGIHENLAEILRLVGDAQGPVVDFGGAGCPLGLGSVVVDLLETDALGRPIQHHDLADFAGQASVLFTSHTLEHIADLDAAVESIARALAPGGTAIIHLPAFTCERWRAGDHHNRQFHDHVWTFGLSGSAVPAKLGHYCEIDTVLARHLSIERIGYCGDDSIFCLAGRP